MYAWETLNIYCLQDRRWFETLARYAPDDTHLAVYRALMPDEWALRRRGLWFVADPPGVSLPEQGWKLHVSARPADAPEALRRAIPVLRDSQTAFKFLLDPWSVALTSGKLWPRGSSGKFITVYPCDVDVFRRLAGELTAALDGLVGPYILSDRRCPGSTVVYYRYGGFTGVTAIQPDGTAGLMISAPDGTLHPDVRHPYWSTPPWAGEDPFGGQDEPAGAAGLAGGRFSVTGAIQFSNRGGVYRGVDNETGRDVVLKEARPHVLVGDSGIPAPDVLAKEHRLLTALADTGYFVRPVALFTEWEHTFLAEDAADGPPLGRFSIGNNPLYGLDLTPDALAAYYGRLRGIWRQVALAIDAAHAAGIALADLSLTNVLVADDDRITVIDVEAAVQAGVDEPVGLMTRGVSNPRSAGSGPAAWADDYYALGSMVFGCVFLANNFTGFHPPARARILTELTADLGLPADLPALVTDLLDEEATEPPAPGVVAKRIAELRVERGRWPDQIPLALPAERVLVGERAAALRREVEHTVAEVARYLVESADPSRDDRLFPADLAVFETNPLSVAFGACGVLYALSRMDQPVSRQLVSWVLRQGCGDDEYPPGLYLGQSGVAWALAELGHDDVAVRILRRAGRRELLWRQPDVLHGSAGHGLACLHLWRRTGRQEFLDAAVAVGARLAADAERDARGARWRNPQGKVPLGYARGGSGVALFLLYLHLATGDPAPLALGRSALDFELSHAVRFSERVVAFPPTADDTRPEVVRDYWDSGTAGVVTTLVRYLAAAPGDDGLRATLRTLLPDLCRKYAVFPQLFHGLAGLGNALLDVAEFTAEPGVLAEAWRVAEGVLLFRIDRPEGTVFPGEQALRECTDLATGSAGVGLFLHRLLTAAPGLRTNSNFVVDDLLPPAAGGGGATA